MAVLKGTADVAELQARGLVRRRPLRLPHWREHLMAYSMVVPALLVLALYVLVPIGYAVWISFQDLRLGIVPFTGASGQAGGYVNPNAHTMTTFFGFRNWTNLFRHDPVFGVAARNTAVMTVGATLIGSICALLMALVTATRLPLMSGLRAAYFFPAAISQFVTGLVFLWMFDQNFGIVNHLLGFVQLGPYLWQDDAKYLLLSLTLAAGWLTASYNLPIFAAALQNVPQALVDAAAVDGAGTVRTFWHVTLPSLRPAIWFVVISSLAAVTQMLALYDALGQDTIESVTLVKYMFARAFYYNDVDYAGAIACVLIVALTAIALLQLWLVEREDA